MDKDTASGPSTVGDMIETVAALRGRRQAINDELKSLNAELEQAEQALMSALDAQGTQFAGSTTHRASITETVVPTVTDWDQVEQYMLEQGALFLLQRRISAPAWRELLESGEPVPGTEPFTKRGISLTKATRR